MNPKDRRLNPLLKLVLDLGPLLLFFLANPRPALFLPLVSPILGPVPAPLAAAFDIARREFPHTCRSRYPSGSADVGGLPDLRKSRGERLGCAGKPT
jgi:hypothetical protein